MKRKTLTLTLSILACLALIGVGFASWIISADTSTNAEGNIIVDTVTDKSYVISAASWKGGNSKISFGAPKEMNVTGAWLTNNSTDKTENLTVTYQLTVTYADTTPATGLVNSNKIVATFGAPNDQNYSKAISDELIIAPKSTTIKELPDGVYEITVTYKWGKHFANSADAEEGVNPYTYYNGNERKANDKIGETSTTYMEDAKTSLKTLENIGANVKFTLTIDIKK